MRSSSWKFAQRAGQTNEKHGNIEKRAMGEKSVIGVCKNVKDEKRRKE